jgi:hypothetical protein
MRIRPVLLAAILCLAGCRDEQAGPHRRQAASTASTASDPGAGRVLTRLDQPLTFRSGAQLGNGAIVYVGARVEPALAKPGQQVRIANYFVAVKPPPEGYELFMHVVDATSGQMVLNADHPIQGGALPIGRWPQQRLIEDITTITLPQGVQASLRVMLGFWKEGAPGEGRLDVTPPQAQDGHDRAIGPTIALEGGPLPEYHVHKTAHPPAIDGDLSDPAWNDAAPVQLVNSFDGSPTQVRTTARLLYDDKFLYVAFDSESPDVWGTLLKRDDPIYTQEAVEVFLDANGDGRTYNELEVSPNNTIFDAYFVERRKPDAEVAKAWDSGMVSAVKVNGTLNNPADRDVGWTAELKVPLERLAEVPRLPPQAGDRWRFNLYRLVAVHQRQVEGQAFSPLFQNDFHNLPRFGWLDFD